MPTPPWRGCEKQVPATFRFNSRKNNFFNCYPPVIKVLVCIRSIELDLMNLVNILDIGYIGSIGSIVHTGSIPPVR